jgi:rare lipoprotein A
MGYNFVLWSCLFITTPFCQNQEASKVEDKESKVVQVKGNEKKDKSGVASFYHNKFEGRKTANGEVFDNDKYTAASNHFKLGSYVKVTNQSNGKVVYVKVNDRMGHPSRMIDLAKVAAQDLKFVNKGTTKVSIEPVSSEEGKRQITAQREAENPATNSGQL